MTLCSHHRFRKLEPGDVSHIADCSYPTSTSLPEDWIGLNFDLDVDCARGAQHIRIGTLTRERGWSKLCLCPLAGALNVISARERTLGRNRLAEISLLRHAALHASFLQGYQSFPRWERRSLPVFAQMRKFIGRKATLALLLCQLVNRRRSDYPAFAFILFYF